MQLPHSVRFLLLKVVNRYLNMDPQSRTRFAPLVGKSLQLQLENILTIDFIFESERMVIASIPLERVDARLFLTLSALSALIHHQSAWMTLVRQEKLDIQGDLQVAQGFAMLCLHCKPDVEEYLSGKIGDVAAYGVVSRVQKCYQKFRQHFEKRQTKLNHVLFDEWQLLLPIEEMKAHQRNIDALEKEINLLETRIIRLQQKAFTCK